MRCRLHQDRQGTRRTEVTARPATNPAQPEHSSAPMNLHPRRDTPVPQNQQTPTAASPAAGVFHSRPFTRHCFPISFSPLPQRQHFPHFAAVAVWPFSRLPCCRPSGPHCHPVPLPQRHYFQRFSAVAAARSGRCRRKLLFPSPSRTSRNCQPVCEQDAVEMVDFVLEDDCRIAIHGFANL